ncbi:MAG: hypothetical protein J0I00_10350 [Burkholderiales bacterium]|nr:hypothetical protein [Burkholderiales bacterium]MBS0402703.1 hypothetical protein [Pseudomonadota bacterium]MBS0415644.1 hypothetical protein [Pseudomonadota bacterium]HMN58110.1 hypothetical protein [Ottowia sp.]
MPALLVKILSDVVGFVGGALAGYWLARAAGIDVLRDLHSNASVLGIAAIGLGGGIGLAAARRWRQARDAG